MQNQVQSQSNVPNMVNTFPKVRSLGFGQELPVSPDEYLECGAPFTVLVNNTPVTSFHPHKSHVHQVQLKGFPEGSVVTLAELSDSKCRVYIRS